MFVAQNNPFESHSFFEAYLPFNANGLVCLQQQRASSWRKTKKGKM